MKKALCLLIVLCLFGCTSQKEEETIDITDKYIKPLNEVNFFNELNSTTKDILLNIYGEDKVDNNLLEMLDKELCDLSVNDYYDNTINFSDYQNSTFIFEIVQYSCDHCKKQVPLTETILANEDATIIQYFAFGDKEQIDEFYETAAHEMPKDVIVIPQNDELSSYVTSLGVNSTPTFVFYKDGKVRFACIGELSYAKYLKAIRMIDEYPITKEALVDNEDTSVFSLYRGYDDVLNDISSANKDRLAMIDNAEEITVNVIGQTVKLNELYEKEGEALYSITSYEKYINKPLVVFYVGYIHNNLEKDVGVINDFAKNHKDINMLTILMDTKDLETSSLYKQANLELLTDVVSSNSEIPKQFLDTSVISYPAAIFIQENTFVGGLHSFENKETLENAYEIFMGDNSISIASNN